MVGILWGARLFLGGLQLAAALPQPRDAPSCTVKTQRKPWQNLTSTERADYINATLCLMNSPAKVGTKGAKTRWDELQYVHIVQSDYIHFVGSFLPWHRYYLKVHETMLKDECGYKGAMPYWDERLDVKDIKQAAIFDPHTGFGGDGVAPYGCIADGPFANLTLRFQSDLSTRDYCIIRHMNTCPFGGAAQASLDVCFAMKAFSDVTHCWEGRPHAAGHAGVGGVMVNTQLSPGDPVFFLHHAFLDSLWWKWQSMDLANRLTDIGGPNIPASAFPFPFPLPGANGTLPNITIPGTNISFTPGPDPACLPPGFGGGAGTAPPGNVTFPPFSAPAFKENTALTHYFNDGGNVTTLKHTLWSVGILPNATIADVMDVRGPYVCTEYM
ncbi:Di-copper centre-containing protein [Thozetella sp. PMI_491]|nr:Di-copper centre-containing protein [Thozetella sp. PMI_491]